MVNTSAVLRRGGVIHVGQIDVNGSTNTSRVYAQGGRERGAAQLVFSGPGTISAGSKLQITGAPSPTHRPAKLLDADLDLSTVSSGHIITDLQLMPAMRAEIRSGATTGGAVSVDIYFVL